MKGDLPKRKNLRLTDLDYSQAGYYFVTLCTKDKRCILGDVVGRDDLGAPSVALSSYGRVAEKYLLSIDPAYENVRLDRYVIMPNHIHMILCIGDAGNGAPRPSRPTNLLSGVIGCFKRFSNRDTGQKLWQTSFYDHVIRNEEDYLRIWQYIDDNPAKWADDEYYCE